MDNLFEHYIITDDFHFKFAKGEPALKEQEFHDYHEFVFFVGGSAYFISKNIQKKLSPGSIIIVPKEHYHQFCIENEENYVRYILGFYETDETRDIICEVMNDVKVIANPDSKITYLMKQLGEAAQSNMPDNEKKIFARATLEQILILFKQCGFDSVKTDTNLSTVSERAIDYIDQNYMNQLSVEGIANELYVSSSTLSHKFSSELNISVYRYITKKRLAEAHRLIESGESYFRASALCGFGDYSCFYRLYKKYYR